MYKIYKILINYVRFYPKKNLLGYDTVLTTSYVPFWDSKLLPILPGNFTQSFGKPYQVKQSRSCPLISHNIKIEHKHNYSSVSSILVLLCLCVPYSFTYHKQTGMTKTTYFITSTVILRMRTSPAQAYHWIRSSKDAGHKD